MAGQPFYKDKLFLDKSMLPDRQGQETLIHRLLVADRHFTFITRSLLATAIKPVAGGLGLHREQDDLGQGWWGRGERGSMERH